MINNSSMPRTAGEIGLILGVNDCRGDEIHSLVKNICRRLGCPQLRVRQTCLLSDKSDP